VGAGKAQMDSKLQKRLICPHRHRVAVPVRGDAVSPFWRPGALNLPDLKFTTQTVPFKDQTLGLGASSSKNHRETQEHWAAVAAW
jgi:hypothetical protein